MLASQYSICTPGRKSRAGASRREDGSNDQKVAGTSDTPAAPWDIKVLLGGHSPSFGALSAAVSEAFGPVGARITRRGEALVLRATMNGEAAEEAATRLLARLPGAVLDAIIAVRR